MIIRALALVIETFNRLGLDMKPIVYLISLAKYFLFERTVDKIMTLKS
jgi:hypothetical protein